MPYLPGFSSSDPPKLGGLTFIPVPTMQPVQRSIYAKPARSHDELIALYEARGLLVPDHDCAERYLRHIGYYRLSPYTLPFQTSQQSHHFKKGTTFDDVLTLYIFDRELRLLVMDALERVEVAVRSALSDTMVRTAPGKEFWYLENQNFKKDFMKDVISKQCEEVRERTRKQERPGPQRYWYPDALPHYLEHYDDPPLPPSWLAIELLTLGQLFRVYEGLADRKAKKQVARTVSTGLTDTVLESWLRSYVRVRNICAHHERLWNRILGTYPVIPRNKDIQWLTGTPGQRPGNGQSPEQGRLYLVLVSLQSILFTVSPRSTWASRLTCLLDRYPHVPRQALGMPEGWSDDPFWRKALESSRHRRSQTHREARQEL